VQIVGRIAGVTAALTLGLAAPAVAAAQSPSTPSRQAAVDVYVEELPTATGLAVAGPASLSAQIPSSVSGTGTGGSGGVIGLVLVLFGVTVGIVLGRVRTRGSRSNRG
jgi:hypothetical protein